MYKLIAVDMDGTLLNSKGEISQYTFDIIREARKEGIHFILSSGRPFQGLQKMVELLKLKGPIITYNGAMIVIAENQKITYQISLEPNDARVLIDLGIKYQTSMCIWSQNQLYTNQITERVNDYKKISGVEPIVVNNYDDIINQGITKILWYDTRDNIEKYLEELKNQMAPSISFSTSRPDFLEFHNSKASKGEALKKVGEYYNIAQDEMIAVGDGMNDLSMIQYAGLGVAMENAPDSLKQQAQYVAPSNDQNGVAEIIKRFILGQ